MVAAIPPASRRRRRPSAAPGYGRGATARRTAATRPRSPRAARPALRNSAATRSGLGDLRHAGLGRHQRAQPRALPGDPGADRDGEALLGRERPGCGNAAPASAAAAICRGRLHLQRVRQAERRRRHPGVEERRAALHPVRHQAAVELQQQVVRQPVRHVGGLRHLQAAAAARLARASAAAMPSRQRRRARAAPRARRTCRACACPAAAPPGPHGAAVAAVAAEHLVAALAGQHHLHVLPRRAAPGTRTG